MKDSEVATTFVIVRHAEKSSDDARDPSLSETGAARAQSLARLLADAPLSAAYATGFRRTQQTAQPAADAHGIKITIYDAKMPATAFASQLRAAHAHGTVLVVGHSNTVPEIVAALSGQPVDAMSDDQYDLVYRVGTGSDGKATLTRDRY
jgi:broad specificity phosphatase PhoE